MRKEWYNSNRIETLNNVIKRNITLGRIVFILRKEDKLMALEKVSKKIVKKIEELHIQNVDPNVIAGVLDIAESTVKNVIAGKYVRTSLTEADDKRIHALWEEGLSVKEIREKTGWTEPTIAKVLKDVRKQVHKIKDDEHQYIRQLYQEGKKPAQIARITNHSIPVIMLHLEGLVERSTFKRLTQDDKDSILVNKDLNNKNTDDRDLEAAEANIPINFKGQVMEIIESKNVNFIRIKVTESDSDRFGPGQVITVNTFRKHNINDIVEGYGILGENSLTNIKLK